MTQLLLYILYMFFPKGKAEVLHLRYGCFTQSGRRGTPKETSNVNTEEWQNSNYSRKNGCILIYIHVFNKKKSNINITIICEYQYEYRSHMSNILFWQFENFLIID